MPAAGRKNRIRLVFLCTAGTLRARAGQRARGPETPKPLFAKLSCTALQRFKSVVQQSYARRMTGQGQFLTINRNSFNVLSDLIRFARQLMTHTLPRTYPLEASLRSIVGEPLFGTPALTTIGMPSSGHLFGTTMSANESSKSRPYALARSFAALSIFFLGSAACRRTSFALYLSKFNLRSRWVLSRLLGSDA